MYSDVYDRLREQYPWPSNRPLPAVDAFDWTLDGGGRDLLTYMFEQRPPKLMVEVGSFMGGSALRWLRENPQMKLVCVDPFRDTMSEYIRSIVNAPWAAKYGDLLKYADFIDLYGALNVVRNNLWAYRDRVVLVPGTIQEKAPELKGLDPDVSFTDAMKEREEFDILDSLFPDAIFTGDDWNWMRKDGEMPIQIYASEVADRRGGDIYAKASTFLINEPRIGLNLSPALLYKSVNMTTKSHE
jgi:hypothetical protein